MVQVHCYACEGTYNLPGLAEGQAPHCPACGSEFCEVLPAPTSQQQGQQGQQRQGQAGAWQWSFGPGSLGMSGRISVSGGRGGTTTVHLGNFPASGTGGTGMDPFAEAILGALLGPGGPAAQAWGGGLHPFPFPVGMGAPGDEQAWLDQVMSQVMEQYEPQSTATDERLRRSLPRLIVRPKAASREPQEGEAACQAGEPCSVCHDEFQEGATVLELPCQHCFHEGCIMPWLESHNTCPVCRLELRPASASASSASSGGRQGSQQQQARGQQGQQGQQPREGPGGSGSFSGGQRPEQGAGQGTGQSLHSILQSIAGVWNSYHNPAASAAQQEAAAAAGGGGGAPSGGASAGGGEGAARQQQQAQQQAPPNPRAAAAAAAERRQRARQQQDGESLGQEQYPSYSSGPAQQQQQQQAQQQASWRQQQAQAQAQAQHHSAARSGADDGSEGEEEREEAGQSLLAMVVGGALGALAGGALSALFGGANRRR